MTVEAARTGPGETSTAPAPRGGRVAPTPRAGTGPAGTAPTATESTGMEPAGTEPAGTGSGGARPTGRRSPADAADGSGPRRPSLSPSRAADFKTCPLLYRFRSIDRLPERPTPDQLRGTLVHAVLDRLFDFPAAQRTPQRAAELVEPQWWRMVEEQAELLDVFAGAPPATAREDPTTPPGDGPAPGAGDPATGPEGGAAAGPEGGPRPEGAPPARGATMTPEEFLAGARELLGGYFAVEDPRRLAPAERECLVSVEVDDGRLLLRGYIDRLDVSPAGDLRVVDYKTGGAPREAFEARALFQLKFYALVLWRTRGVVPKVLRLLYLKDAEVCDYTPDVDELDRFERTLIALWSAIDRATADQDFRPKPSRLCGWCAHQALCPAFGGTPPPFPELVAAASGQAPDPMDE